MTVDFWRNAELFYEFWFLILSVFLLFSLFVLIFGYTYAEKKNRKKLFIGVLSVLLVIGLFGICGHTRYEVYLDQASHVTPLIRDRQPRLRSYIYYGTYEQSYYTQFNELESLRQVDLYEEEQIVEPLVYLGKGDDYYYFEQSDGQSFKHYQGIEFTEATADTQLTGSRFALKDEDFKEIGFKNPSNTMYDQIQIPHAEKEKHYEPEEDTHIPNAEDAMNRWNF